MSAKPPSWPDLPLDQWRHTYRALHMWCQIVGKIRMSLMPWTNHSWHVPLYVSARGLTTSLIPGRDAGLELELDLSSHRMLAATADGERRAFALQGLSVAEFYAKLMRALSEMGVEVRIRPMPAEIPDPVLPFDRDNAVIDYDPQAADNFRRILLQVQRVFINFRARFIGKASPVHFFWGAFDLAVTRFSGRTAPKHPGGVPHCADWVMQEAYSHEVSSAGFWPGEGLGEAAFYSYAYPSPEGFSTCRVRPAEACYHEGLREFILPYEAVRTADDPDHMLMEFLQSTYEAAAELSGWDRDALERGAHRPG